MSPVLDTAATVFQRWPLGVVLWALFALLPVMAPAAVAVTRVPRAQGRFGFVSSAAARIVGYPCLLLLLLGVPWVAFQVLFVPVVLDAYPDSKPFLAVPLSASAWLLQHWFWFAPLAWLLWVFAATVRFSRRWSATHAAG